MSSTLSEEQTKKLNWFVQKVQKDKEEYQELSKQSIFASNPLISSFFEKPKDLQEMYQKTAQKLADIEVIATYLAWHKDYAGIQLEALYKIYTVCIDEQHEFEANSKPM